MQTVTLNEVNGTVCIYNIFFLYGIIFKICYKSDYSVKFTTINKYDYKLSNK